MSVAMERTPHTFSQMMEEEIRDLFLVYLNGHFKGEATGESFNVNGKTDILIRHNGKNIFIAECKFWRGEKVFIDTIDQILGYVSWRDTKTAILLFNKNKNLTRVLNQIEPIMKNYPNYISTEKYVSETEFKFYLHHNSDKKRRLTMTVMVFDVPK
ncbi:hypothetical protein LCGC14_3129100 [marine sediment metagenome]|uniref:Restriction endonuclease type IV Mrr domain-containing protein n=1 Tax=marine sediment metagenome TaxID=412755 RepID=A0A0F8WP13_9ZZZZ